MIEKYMERFQEELELTKPFKKPTPQSYLIPLDEGLSVTVTLLQNGFSLFSEFAKNPSENEEFVYTEALMANLFGEGTRGSLIGLNEKGNMLTISRIVDYNIEYKDFKELIEDFIQTVDFWKDRIENLKV